jgi:plastocyanin
MKRLLAITVTAIAGAALVAAIASAGTAKAPKTATVMIRHQMRGCHAWSVNGGAFKPTQTLTLARGGTIAFVNNDVMPHRLVEKSGPPVKFVGKPNMNHMSAGVKIVLTKAGTYHFATKAGEDYPGMTGMKTIGEDNVLKLTVKVA